MANGVVEFRMFNRKWRWYIASTEVRDSNNEYVESGAFTLAGARAIVGRKMEPRYFENGASFLYVGGYRIA